MTRGYAEIATTPRGGTLSGEGGPRVPRPTGSASPGRLSEVQYAVLAKGLGAHGLAGSALAPGLGQDGDRLALPQARHPAGCALDGDPAWPLLPGAGLRGRRTGSGPGHRPGEGDLAAGGGGRSLAAELDAWSSSRTSPVPRWRRPPPAPGPDGPHSRHRGPRPFPPQISTAARARHKTAHAPGWPYRPCRDDRRRDTRTSFARTGYSDLLITARRPNALVWDSLNVHLWPGQGRPGGTD